MPRVQKANNCDYQGTVIHFTPYSLNEPIHGSCMLSQVIESQRTLET